MPSCRSARHGTRAATTGCSSAIADGAATSCIRPNGSRRCSAASCCETAEGLTCIARALRQGAFADALPADGLTPQGNVLRNLIAGTFVSHAHLDHVGGLLVAATEVTMDADIKILAGLLAKVLAN